MTRRPVISAESSARPVHPTAEGDTMPTQPHRLQTGAVVSAVLLLTAACGGDTDTTSGSDGGSRELNVGYIADYNGGALFAIADEQGLWDEAGIEPTYQSFTNGPLSIQALGAGDLDIAYIGPGATWLAAQDRAEIWSVNSASKADRVIAQPGMTSMADLEGARVGVPEGTSGDLLLSLALEHAGMSRDDVQIVPMDPSAVVSSFSSGQIDAAGIWYPLVDNIKESVPDLAELADNEQFMPEQTFPSSVIAQEGLAEEDPELAADVISVLKQANDYRYENQDETVTLAAEFLDLEKEKIAPQAEAAQLFTTEELQQWTSDGTVNGWFTGLQELFVDVGTVESVSDPENFYTGDAYVDAPAK